MKIIFFNLNGRGGMIHYASQFANAMAKKHNVYVVLPDYSDSDIYSDKIKLLRIKAPSNMTGTLFRSFDILQYFAFKKIIKEINPDIVHILDNHPWYLIYGKRYKDKLFVTQHDPLLHMGEHGWYAPIADYINKKLRQWAKKVFVHGQKIKESITDIPQGKIEIIPHGNYSFFKDIHKGTLADNKPVDILFFGRILNYKGVDVLVEAAKQLPDLNFFVVGGGDISRYEKPPNVCFVNENIMDSEVGTWFEKTKMVVLPYKEASQSGVIPIAYTFKKPVIVTDVGSLPEIVLDGITGTVIKPNNPYLLADAIRRLLKEDLERMGENCYKYMEDNLSWDKITDKVIGVYQE